MRLKEIQSLYHGTAREHTKINLLMARPFKDFGRGYYLTTSKEQAMKWASRGNHICFAYEYSVQQNITLHQNLRILELLEYDQKWLDFIVANRLGRDTADYDIVYDRLADNRGADISRVVHSYRRGEIKLNCAIKELKWKSQAADQFCFRTEKSLQLLTRVNAFRREYDESGSFIETRC